ncbi:MAG: extracellular solute-binding protein family 1 [Thermoleophilia bacterium]|nr:extracellular solute-binding protein family 1 [Thermoleophilia bacterium]
MGRERDDARSGYRDARIRAFAILLVLVFAALLAAGCGSSADDADANGVPVLGFMTWRDQTGFDEEKFAKCAKESGGKYRIEAIPMGPSVDAAREQLTRRLAAGDDSIDMINLDVIWTAEFSDAGWILDLSERMGPIADQYVPAALESTRYKDKYWAVPAGTNAALMYYRTDLVDHAPETYEELAEMAKAAQAKQPGIAGFVFQGNSYEGGMVDALEFMGSANAKVLSDDGTKATLDDGDGATYALSWLQSIMDDKVSPKVVTTFMEEDARLAFQKGDAVFMRNWPYAWALMNQDKASKVKGKFDIAPLPGFKDRSSASVLGGQNLGISSSTKHPELAWEAMMCLTGEDIQREKAVKKGEMPTLKRLYSDPQMAKDVPFIDVLAKGLETGVNRPTTPYYNDVTIVIYKAYNDVLNGRLTPEEAVKEMQHGVQAALDGKAEI